MHFNIDQALNEMTPEPWDLTLTIDGVVYTTKPLETGDLHKLQYAEKVGLDYQRALVKGLFADALPDVMNWDAARVANVVAAIVGYQQGRLLKNTQAIAVKVATAVATGSK
jgi:hypothetical protein